MLSASAVSSHSGTIPVGKVDLKNAQPQTHLLNLIVFRYHRNIMYCCLKIILWPQKRKVCFCLVFFSFFFLSLFLLITACLTQSLKADLSLEHTNLLTDFIPQSEHFLLKIVQGLKTRLLGRVDNYLWRATGQNATLLVGRNLSLEIVPTPTAELCEQSCPASA